MKGVRCPHCHSCMQVSTLKINDVAKCANCNRPFVVSAKHIKAYKQLNPSLANKLFKKVALIAGIIVAALVFVFVKVNVLDSANTLSSHNEYKAEDYFSGWDGSNTELVSYVKANMHDPSSFEHVDTRYGDKGDSYSIKMTFRGSNAFNAVVTQTVTANLDKATRQLSNVQQVE